MQRALLINHYTIFNNEMKQTQICSDRLKQLLTDLKNFMLNPVNSPTKNSNLKLDELFFEINRFEILLELTKVSKIFMKTVILKILILEIETLKELNFKWTSLERSLSNSK